MESGEQRAESREQPLASQKQVPSKAVDLENELPSLPGLPAAKSREQRAESGERRAESRERRAESAARGLQKTISN